MKEETESYMMEGALDRYDDLIRGEREREREYEEGSVVVGTLLLECLGV